MRRTATLLSSALLLAVLVLASLPAFAANVGVTNTGAAGDCSGNFGYEPTAASIAPGDSVTFTNPRVHSNGCSSEGHPTQCLGAQSNGECPWKDVKDLPSGGQFTVTFPAEGTFKYRCVAHPYMEGTVTVGDGDPSQPSPEPTSEPEPTTPPPSSEPEPTSEPEPEPTSDAPTSDPEPTAGETSGEDPDEPTTDAPETDEPTEDETSEPDEDPTTETTSGSDDEPADDATIDAGEVSAELPEGSGGTGLKVLATVALLGTGGALWSVRRGG